MLHMYITSDKLGAGVDVDISGHPIHPGDKMIVEYPNNTRGEATVASVNQNQNLMEIVHCGKTWRLALVDPCKIVTDPADQAIPSKWAVQP